LGAIFVAPQNPLELQMTKIWEEVLGTQPIGVRDNFFELGGHSLLAVRLFTQIEKAFGKNFPLATLFQAPTIEQLANIFHQEEWSAPWRSLVVMQPGGSKPPFFFVHALGGNVLSYHDLVHYLGPDQPVYGLQARGLDGKEPPHNRIEDMAADYIKEILEIQPEGPYFLGGYSFGGAVAFEMAHQLYTKGQKVALLVLLDTLAPTVMRNLPLRERVFVHWKNLLQEGYTYALHKLGWRISSINDRLLRSISRIYRKFDPRSGQILPSYLTESQLDVRQQFYHQALRNYVPCPYLGKVILFQSVKREQHEAFYTDPQKAWGKLAAGGLEVHEVPGDHISLIKEPHVQVLAEKLRDCLERAQVDDSTFKREKPNS
jgi:thioesterase domain-containing protein/acyl carrier protein